MNKLLKLSAASLLVITGFSANADTLSDVKAKGSLSCGVSTGTPGFSNPDSSGNWSGMDVDVCRAIAAATLGDDRKVKYVPLSAKERFIALQSGEIDVLSRNTTWTHTRDTSLGLNFAGVNYYDGQGFMVKKSLGVNSVKGLDGASFCIQAGTTTELNLADYFRSNNMKFKAVTYDTSAQTKGGFEAGRCDALTSDVSQLAGLRSTLKDPSSAVVLGDVISKEPLGPVVRQGDDNWFNIVKWSLNAMIEAEELGITSRTIDRTSTSPGVQRLQGKTGKLNEHLGLNKDWARNIIAQVGNYGESFERNIGMSTPIALPRGVNQLWIKGGILYSPAFR
ncbi:amino acid ABC transporter substrate-binding protein [Candidatus Thioglobus sp.]|nr:amino acid ABC transporter substrate-binding protein [Candidatus Thioglobus sp.]MDB3869736.1 amino acid ABC transporter substrate-binding protein [Candidatus Thioglobus sp.]MDB3892960.1 amino acid ABC transporter substrate-binding protein [Candidatus Thioglobus sp.]MDC0904420.1 amino acid ABC transporter substrate-binding protein [Candidatus Thioglobus sp.]MDC0964889.1 amino acid ABC transporter substrate-binding protein [Candidatus Thioglobus sp.]